MRAERILAESANAMNEQERQILERRYPLWYEQPEWFEAILSILFAYDPMGICMEENSHRETEYSPEANTILPRLDEATSRDDVRQIVHEEFIRWFGGSR